MPTAALGHSVRSHGVIYPAHDGQGAVVGRFPDLPGAMAAVTNSQPPHDAPITLEQVSVPAPRSADDGSAVA